MNATQWMNRVIKPAVFVLCLLPLVWLGWDAYMHQLGANPVEKMSHRTGEWAFKLLLITLTVTPLRKLTGWNSVIRLRRVKAVVREPGIYALIVAALRGWRAWWRRRGDAIRLRAGGMVFREMGIETASNYRAQTARTCTRSRWPCKAFSIPS